jgi:hypothetical protein
MWLQMQSSPLVKSDGTRGSDRSGGSQERKHVECPVEAGANCRQFFLQ